MTAAPALDPFRHSEAAGPAADPQPAVIEEITPQMAHARLDRHREIIEARKVAGMGHARDNRPVRWGDVSAYSRDMQAGNWQVNGETIKHDVEGAIIDGQHRYLACRIAETSFRSYVITGLPPEAQDTVDIGIKRKLADQLAINGEPNATTLASVARWSLRWLKGVRGGTFRSGGTFNPTQQELLDYIAHTPHLRDAASFAMHAYSVFRLVRPSAYGMAWLIFNGSNSVAARVFFDGLLTGAGLPLGNPVLELRNRLLSARDREEKIGEQQQLAWMIIAWNALVADKDLARKDFPAVVGVKNFPEPN